MANTAVRVVELSSTVALSRLSSTVRAAAELAGAVGFVLADAVGLLLLMVVVGPTMPEIQPLMGSIRPLRSTLECGHDGPPLTTDTRTAVPPDN